MKSIQLRSCGQALVVLKLKSLDIQSEVNGQIVVRVQEKSALKTELSLCVDKENSARTQLGVQCLW